MKPVLKAGTRPSPLAIKQTEEIKRLFPFVQFEVILIETKGDKDKKTLLSNVEGSDFFTKEIDDALLSGRIDIGVHSAKDMPEVLPKGLAVVFETASISPNDALISRGNLKFAQLVKNSRVGLSSARRKGQIQKLRKDLRIVDIRGTIGERIALLDSGKIDALIVAYAALVRLGLNERIAEIFPLDILQAHPKQGKLSLVAREEDCEGIKSILSAQARVTGN